MKLIPLNVQTIYADLLQSRQRRTAAGASVTLKTIKGRKYAYATARDGITRTERYLGPADEPAVVSEMDRLRADAASDRQARKTVTLLKAANLPAPSAEVGRLLEVVANAGLFARGVTLVGTAAYNCFPGLIGAVLPAASLLTQDIDLSLVEFAAGDHEEPLIDIIKRADPAFAPDWRIGDELPKAFVSPNGLSVELLTKLSRKRSELVLVPGLSVAAVPLSFQEYLTEGAVPALALYNRGILVRVPSPLRYAIHKLIIADRRQPASPKRSKDLAQAVAILDCLMGTDPDLVVDELDAARERGPGWRKHLTASLRAVRRVNARGELPVPDSGPVAVAPTSARAPGAGGAKRKPRR